MGHGETFTLGEPEVVLDRTTRIYHVRFFVPGLPLEHVSTIRVPQHEWEDETGRQAAIDVLRTKITRELEAMDAAHATVDGFGRKTVPCTECGKPTALLGTKLCDPCWEAQRHIPEGGAILDAEQVAALVAWAEEERRPNGCSGWGPKFTAAFAVARSLRDRKGG